MVATVEPKAWPLDPRPSWELGGLLPPSWTETLRTLGGIALSTVPITSAENPRLELIVPRSIRVPAAGAEKPRELAIEPVTTFPAVTVPEAGAEKPRLELAVPS